MALEKHRIENAELNGFYTANRRAPDVARLARLRPRSPRRVAAVVAAWSGRSAPVIEAQLILIQSDFSHRNPSFRSTARPASSPAVFTIHLRGHMRRIDIPLGSKKFGHSHAARSL